MALFHRPKFMSHFGFSSMSNLLIISTWRYGEVPVTYCALEWCLCMNPLMILQISWSWKALATLVQFDELSPVWVLSWIFTWYGNAPVTFATLQWFLLFMDPLIVHQSTWFWEALATLWSIGWLLSSVITFMNFHLMWKNSCHIWCTSMVVSFMDPLIQVSWYWEALATLYALEWLLSSVTSLMNRHLMWKSSWDFNGLFPSWILW